MNITANRRNILSNLGWSVLGKVVSLSGSLLVGLLIARYLGPERWGLLNYIISEVFLFQVFAVFGLDSIEIREQARCPDEVHSIMGTAFVIRLVLAFFALIALVVTAWTSESDNYTALMLSIYGFTMLFSTLNVIRNHFMAKVQNKYVVKSEISRTLVGMILKLVLFFFGIGLTGFILATAFDSILLASGYVVSYRRKVGSFRQWRFDIGWCRLLLRESFPLMLTSAAVMVYQRIDQVMIGRMIDKQAVGYFSTASRFVEVLVYVPMMLSQTISPVLTRIRTYNEEAYRERAQFFMNVSVWVSLVLSGVMSALSYWIVTILLGPHYLPSVSVLQIMSFKAASVALSSTAGAMIVVEGLQRWTLVRDLFGCMVCVLLNYFLLPHYGIVAAAFVAIASNVAAGWLADMFVPSYRHLFRMQTKALLFGWRSLFNLRELRGIK